MTPEARNWLTRWRLQGAPRTISVEMMRTIPREALDYQREGSPHVMRGVGWAYASMKGAGGFDCDLNGSPDEYLQIYRTPAGFYALQVCLHEYMNGPAKYRRKDWRKIKAAVTHVLDNEGALP